MPESRENTRGQLRALIQTALLLAIALVLRNVSPMLYFGGGTGMRLEISGFFTRLPALLFGPVYGGAAAGLADLLGYLIKPEGAYLWPLTLTAILGGVLSGFLWRHLSPVRYDRFKKWLTVFFVLLAVLGGVNLLAATRRTPAFLCAMLDQIGKKHTFVTWGLMAAGGLGLLFLAAETVLEHRFPKHHDQNFLKLLPVMGLPNLLVTTLNTFLLMRFVPGVGKNGFWAFYAVRLAEELVMIVVTSYVLAYLLKLYETVKNRSR